MHETTLQVLDIRAYEVNENDELLTLVMLTGIPTPFGGPDGNPVTLVSGIYKVPMGKQAALELIESLRTEVDKLPDPKRPSNIVVPGSMAEAEQAARNLERFK